METKMRFIFVLLASLLIFNACEEDDSMAIVALQESEVTIDNNAVQALFVGEDVNTKSLFVKLQANINVVEATSFDVKVVSSDLPEDAVSLPSEITMVKGAQDVELVVKIDGSLVPQDNEERKVVVSLTSKDNLLAGVDEIVYTVYRDVPDAVYEYSSTFWGWENGDWYEWDDLYLNSDESWRNLNLWSWGWVGLWRRDGEIFLHSVGHPMGAIKDGEGYRALFLEEGEIINTNSITWFDERGAADEQPLWDIQPRFKDEWRGKTGYLPIKMVVDNIEVNGWIQISVNGDASDVRLIDMAYETHGLSINAGQKE